MVAIGKDTKIMLWLKKPKRRVQFDKVGLRDKEEDSSAGHVSKVVRVSSRMLHQLLKMIKESKVIGLFCRLVCMGG